MNIKTNSKEVKKGDTFIAIKGYKEDGHNYIEDAINNGASNIICEYGNYKVPYTIIDDTKIYLEEYLKNNYYDYIKDMTFIGITGTNGKTTSCFLIYELLKKLNVKCSYIGTLGFYINEKIKSLNNTTPDILTLYDMFIKCKEEDVKVVVMEVSSHALEQNRVYGIKYDYVVFTNLTVDHLDFHKNIDNYLNAKKKLFTMTKDNTLAVVNSDDKYYKNFIKDNTILYGFNNNNFKICDYKLYIDKVIYKFIYKNKYYKVKINMPGKYNIYNSIISIIILNNMGYKIKDIIKLLKCVTLPDGRMQTVKYKSRYIIVDYAHTPDAVNNVLTSANEFKKRKIYTIIGCGGARDKSKRIDMGIISTTKSDYVIFTNDNPRNEDPKEIMNDITKSLVTNNYEIIYDREKAIHKGIDMLEKNDILFILGKGHEDYQIINNEYHHFNDLEKVLDYIKTK